MSSLAVTRDVSDSLSLMFNCRIVDSSPPKNLLTYIIIIIIIIIWHFKNEKIIFVEHRVCHSIGHKNYSKCREATARAWHMWGPALRSVHSWTNTRTCAAFSTQLDKYKLYKSQSLVVEFNLLSVNVMVPFNVFFTLGLLPLQRQSSMYTENMCSTRFRSSL